MEKRFVQIGGKELPVLSDTTLIGSWDEISELPASTITGRADDKEILDGLIIKGYETKFGNVNENGEIYEKDCIDNFINDYFVARGLNMPLDVQHKDDIQHLAGRIIYIEVNSTGFYFVGYVPKTYMHYEALRGLLKERILQGFSKFGWATDWKFETDENGDFKAMRVKQMQIVAMSLVTTPANGVAFERVQEIRNGLTFVNKIVNQKEIVKRDPLDEMFNQNK